jgi:hypothetical protein
MQSHTNKSSNFLNKPQHILSFIKHVLSPPSPPPNPQGQVPQKAKTGLRIEDLRIVPVPDSDEPEPQDSDDEEPPGDASPDEEMLDTAINLLLAILEGIVNSFKASHTVNIRRRLASSE